MANYVELPVLLEESDELIILNVLAADAIRARNDSAYLLQLANAEKERRSRLSPYVRGAANREYEFIWCNSAVELFLSLYEKHGGVDGPDDIMKTVALSMQQQGYNVSRNQCQYKLNGLKKSYRNIVYQNVYVDCWRIWPYSEQMRRIYGKNRQSEPEALDSDAGSSSPLSSSSVHEEPKTYKKRKLGNIIKKYNAVMEVSKSCRKVREMNKQERLKIKLKKIEEMMAQKERQREEKMKVMNALLEAISKNY